MICRDALDREQIRLVEDMGVNVVLVPAKTQKTASMIQLGMSHVGADQAFVVLAIGPAAEKK